jgi:hypothetical protein
MQHLIAICRGTVMIALGEDHATFPLRSRVAMSSVRHIAEGKANPTAEQAPDIVRSLPDALSMSEVS